MQNLQLRIAERHVSLSTRLFHPLRRPLIRIPLLQSPHVLVKLRVARLAQRNTLAGSLKAKVNHNVCSCDVGATEELSLGRRLDEVIFQEVKVRLELWVYERAVDFGGYPTGDGLEEEGDGGVFDA